MLRGDLSTNSLGSWKQAVICKHLFTTTIEIGAVDVLRSNDSSVGEVIEPAAINNLPLNGRMLIDLVLTVPGAHLGHGAQTGDMNPLYWRPAGFS